MPVTPSAENLVNREAELDVFVDMLEFKDAARLLLVSDKEGTGKTSLLRKMKVRGQWPKEMPICLVDLEAQGTEAATNAFELVDKIRSRLPKLPFTTFDFLNQFRVSYVWAPFLNEPHKLREYLNTVQGVVDLRAGEIDGGKAAGVYIENFNLKPSNQWQSQEQERLARDRCVEAFFHDLRIICKERPVIVLLDHYEHANEALREWLYQELLLMCCRSDENRPERFMLVVAGLDTALPNLQSLLGSEYSRLVRSKQFLGWEEKHVREFLKVNGFEDLSEDDIGIVCEKVAQGYSVRRALRLAEALAR